MPGLTYALALANAKTMEDLGGIMVALLTDLDMMHREMPNRAACHAASLRARDVTMAAMKEPA
jgi:hypothetical protein